MPIWQLCANLLIPNCLRSNLSYSPLAALELYVKNTKPEVDKTKPEPKPEPKPETKTPKPKSWSSYASFDGSTMTFKKAHRIPGTSRVAQPGDKVQGKWVDGEVNLVRWYHADGSPSETLTHE